MSFLQEKKSPISKGSEEKPAICSSFALGSSSRKPKVKYNPIIGSSVQFRPPTSSVLKAARQNSRNKMPHYFSNLKQKYASNEKPYPLKKQINANKTNFINKTNVRIKDITCNLENTISQRTLSRKSVSRDNLKISPSKKLDWKD